MVVLVVARARTHINGVISKPCVVKINNLLAMKMHTFWTGCSSSGSSVCVVCSISSNMSIGEGLGMR